MLVLRAMMCAYLHTVYTRNNKAEKTNENMTF